MRHRCMILGVDGADHGLMRRWMAKGLLPNLARLAERGRMGVLRSTVPPLTAPAWISFMTGEEPGSHGVTGFTRRSLEDGGYTGRLVGSGAIEAPTFWESAGAHGVRALVVNVPVTWPVRRMNGILVSGMLTPDGADFTYPPEYEAELRLLQPDYRIDLVWQNYRFRGHDLVRDQRRVTRARVELCLTLLEMKPWDLFFAVFTGADRLQHCLFRHVDRIHDDDAVRRDTLTAAVRDYFVNLDMWIGDVVRAAGEGVNVFVVSDHGFGALHRVVYFNRWLADEGLLAFKPGVSRRLRKWKRALNSIGVRRATLAAAGRAIGLGSAAGAYAERWNPHVGGIDWKRTRAHYSPPNGFFVNRKGRDRFGCVEPGGEYEAVRTELIRRLEALRDPDTGERMVSRAYRREDAFAGRHLDALPDVVLDFGDRPYDATPETYDVKSFLVKTDWGDGAHRPEGIFLAAGPDVAAGGEVEGLRIFDVAPNLMHCMGCPVPRNMDGAVRADLFARECEPEYEEFP